MALLNVINSEIESSAMEIAFNAIYEKFVSMFRG